MSGSSLEDGNYTIADWVLDTIGLCPESHHDWNDLSKEELNAGFGKDGFSLCCRDNFHLLLEHYAQPLVFEQAYFIVTSWIDMLRVIENHLQSPTQFNKQETF